MAQQGLSHKTSSRVVCITSNNLVDMNLCRIKLDKMVEFLLMNFFTKKYIVGFDLNFLEIGMNAQRIFFNKK